jgi:hypothetical protein
MDLRMLEFVERRRAEQARARRQRIQFVAIVGLGSIGIILAVANVMLVSRLVARPLSVPTGPSPVRSSSARAPMAPPATPATESAAPATEASTQPKASPSAGPSEPMRAAPPTDVAKPSSSVARQPSSTSREPSSIARQPSSAVRQPSSVARQSSSVASQSSSSARQPGRGDDDEPPALPERSPRATSANGRVENAPAPEVRERPPLNVARESASMAVEADPAVRTARWMLQTYGPLDAEARALAAAEFYTGDEGDFWRRVVRHVRAER